MQRREFLGASAAVAGALLTGATRAAETSEAAAGRPLFELRTYHFASVEKRDAYDRFLAEAAVPAMNRAGVEPVGVWKLLAADNPQLHLRQDSTDLYVFLPHRTLESVVAFESALAADRAYQEAGREILLAGKSDPAFSRYDSTLLLAMEGSPKVVVPPKNPDRCFELRTYESPNQERAANKLAMFNAGEFAVFEKVGMPGVFFGGAILGGNLPQLTYMIVHETRESAAGHWKAFGSNPEWKALSGRAIYRDNVSKIIDRYVRPTAASQI